MIPENKRPAVVRALKSAFKVDDFEDIQQLTKGLSSALVYRITVHGNPYLLRVVTRTDAFGDPSFYYGCMEQAADYRIAPRIHYLSIEDRVSIIDFISEKPFSIHVAKQELPQLLRKLHALPKFPYRNNYFELVQNFLPQLRGKNLLSNEQLKVLDEIYTRIVNVYPINDQDHWVSSHNDSKPDNIVFDGKRPWLVDWESAFLNDPYLDLSIVANFVVIDELDEINYLQSYFAGTLDNYKSARFFLMQEILHLYYFIFLVAFDQGENPIELDKIKQCNFREFHNKMWNGDITITSTQIKREYAVIHWNAFLNKAESKRFEESLRLVSRKN